MPKRYSVELEIDQPRSRVAELFFDAENLGAWQPGFESIEHLEGEEGQSGAKSWLLRKGVAKVHGEFQGLRRARHRYQEGEVAFPEDVGRIAASAAEMIRQIDK